MALFFILFFYISNHNIIKPFLLSCFLVSAFLLVFSHFIYLLASPSKATSRMTRCLFCLQFIFPNYLTTTISLICLCVSRSSTRKSEASPQKASTCDQIASTDVSTEAPFEDGGCGVSSSSTPHLRKASTDGPAAGESPQDAVPPAGPDAAAAASQPRAQQRGEQRGAMHVLCSPTVKAHMCGGYKNFYAWLLNGLIADALEANTLAKLECFVFAQRLPADTVEGVNNEISLVEDTFPHHTGCLVRDLPNVSALSGPESAQGRDVSFNERGLFWEPSHLPDGTPWATSNAGDELQQMFGFWYPKCGLKSLEKMWRALGLLDSRSLYGLRAGINGIKLPDGLKFYVAPSNCLGYFANHYNKLAPEPNAEFTDHWAQRGSELVPTFTFFLRATRKLELNEQILIDYGPDFATLEPHEDQQLDIGGDSVPATKKSKRKRDGLGNGKQTRWQWKRDGNGKQTRPIPGPPPAQTRAEASIGTAPNTPPRAGAEDSNVD